MCSSLWLKLRQVLQFRRIRGHQLATDQLQPCCPEPGFSQCHFDENARAIRPSSSSYQISNMRVDDDLAQIFGSHARKNRCIHLEFLKFSS